MPGVTFKFLGELPMRPQNCKVCCSVAQYLVHRSNPIHSMRTSLPQLGHRHSVARQPQATWQPPSFTCKCPCVRATYKALAQQARSNVVVHAAQQPASNEGGGGITIVPLPPFSDVQYVEGEFVEVGTVGGGFGIKGEVRIDISTDNPKRRFGQSGKKIYLLPPPATGLLARSQNQSSQGMLQLTTASTKVKVLPKKEEAWIVQFQELHDRSQADQLLGWRLMIPASERERLRDPDEFWVQDLVGCRAFLQADGKYVGKVIDVISGTGTYDTLLLQLAVIKDDIINSRTRLCMVPFVKAMVPHVDQDLGQIGLDPPEGLLDMFSYNPLKRKLTDQQKQDKMAALDQFKPPVFGQAGDEGDAVVAAETPEPPVPTSRAPKAPKAAKKERAASGTTATTTASSAKAGIAKPAAAVSKPARAPVKPAVVKQDEEEEVDDGEEVESSAAGSSKSDAASSLERWRLRRKLGVSLGSRQRRMQ